MLVCCLEDLCFFVFFNTKNVLDLQYFVFKCERLHYYSRGVGQVDISKSKQDNPGSVNKLIKTVVLSLKTCDCLSIISHLFIH